MRTRNSGTPKPVPEKKTLPARKGKATQSPSTAESVTPKSRGRPSRKVAATTVPETEEEEIGLAASELVTPKSSSSGKPATRKAPTRTKTPTSAKVVSKRTPKSGKAAAKAGKSLNDEDGITGEKVEESEDEDDNAITVDEEPAGKNGNDDVEEELLMDAVESLVEEKTVIQCQEISLNDVTKQEERVTETQEVSMTDIVKQEITVIKTQELSTPDIPEQERSIQDGDSLEKTGSVNKLEVELVTDVVKTSTEQKTVIETQELSTTDVSRPEIIVNQDEESAEKNESVVEVNEELVMDAVESLIDDKTVIGIQESSMTDVEEHERTVIQDAEKNESVVEVKEELVMDAVESLIDDKTVIGTQESSMLDVEEHEQTVIQDVEKNEGVVEVKEELVMDAVESLIEDKTVIGTQESSMPDVEEHEQPVIQDAEKNESFVEVKEELVIDAVESLIEDNIVIGIQESSMTDVEEHEQTVIQDAEKNESVVEVKVELVMDAVESLIDDKTLFGTQETSMTDVEEHEQTVIQDGGVPLVKCGKSEKSGAVDEGVPEESKVDAESKLIEVPEENKMDSSNMEDDLGKDQSAEMQEELKEGGESKTIEDPDENKMEPSYMVESISNDQADKVQEELKAGGKSKITEVTDKSKTGPSNIEEDPIEDQIEEIQEDVKADPEKKKMEDTEESEIESSVMKKDSNEVKTVDNMSFEGNENKGEEVLEDDINLEEHGEKETANGNEGGATEEAEALEEEHMELTAIAQERKIERENEIFVGGLDRDTFEEDVRNVFEKMGEIVEVRMHKSYSKTENNGYALVVFANKEHAIRTLSEMKNPVICGNRCETAASKDNSSLFLGNICNTWTKEAIKQKLKDYGLEGIENITLVPDAQREGLSRGFAFIEFACHANAMVAYKRLQRPDAVFGHHERTVKVAFAEPLPEPNSDIMAQVKSVFVDGLPPHWDETLVQNQFKGYGEIERIVLARNMSNAKRKDFGFVHFTTHEAAVACIESINITELDDGNTKTKVRARLSNPLPKTQAVKGGMLGGHRIGHAGGGGFPKYGRGTGRGTHVSNQGHLQRGRGFYQHGHGQPGRIGFPGESAIDNRYPGLHARQGFERGGRGFPRGSYQASGSNAAATGLSRPFLDRPMHNFSDVERGNHVPPRRQAFPPAGLERPFSGGHFEDAYRHENNMHGMKRPFHMTDQDPSYMEPNRLRPRLDYSNPPISYRDTHHRDTVTAGTNVYLPHDHYGPNYGRGAPSSFYGGERPPIGGFGGAAPQESGHGGALPHGGVYGADRPLGRGYGGDRPHGGRGFGGGRYY